MENKYGAATGIEDFCLKGQVMNYESARGMFEAYARNKYDALGITTWKYDAAWPAALTWQYVDWYLNVGGAYYGAKKACEPLHVQYSYDDHSVYVLNSYYHSFENLKVQARLLNFDLSEKYERTAEIGIANDGKVEVFKIDLPKDLSTTYFLDLKLFDKNSSAITSNFYWLSTIPDIEGTKKGAPTPNGWWALKTSPKSYADFTDLQKLPKIKLQTSYDFTTSEKEKIAHVFIKNQSSSLAFMIHLAVTKDKNGDEIAPTYWSDNYFSLLPGESRHVSGRFSKEDLAGAMAVVKIDGWNVE